MRNLSLVVSGPLSNAVTFLLSRLRVDKSIYLQLFEILLLLFLLIRIILNFHACGVVLSSLDSMSFLVSKPERIRVSVKCFQELLMSIASACFCFFPFQASRRICGT